MKIKVIILILIVMLVCLAIFSGCDTENTGSVNSGTPTHSVCSNYPHAYMKIGEEWVDVEISTYSIYEARVQLTLTNGTKLWTHLANCILYNGELPIQGGNND